MPIMHFRGIYWFQTRSTYKLIDLNWQFLITFHGSHQTKGFKVPKIGIRCYLPQNTYICTVHFSKIHLAVPACCTGLYTRHFSKGHSALQAYYMLQRHLLTSNMEYKFINFKKRILNLFLIFQFVIWFSSSEDWHKELFATKYQYT